MLGYPVPYGFRVYLRKAFRGILLVTIQASSILPGKRVQGLESRQTMSMKGGGV